ncbi:MAG: hypothetical protein QM769_14095 [Pseudoxanthomonas sp.]
MTSLQKLLALAAFAVVLPLVLAAQAGEPTPATGARAQAAAQGGVVVEWSFRQGEAGNGIAHLAIRDEATGKPIEGARPAAWLLARRSELVASEQHCEQKAALMVGGSLGSRADIDLNGYRLLTLNNDNTVAFINPYVGLRNSRLESIVELPATGHDWVLAPEVHRLFVSLREADAVAVIDTLQRRLLATVPTGKGSLPTRLAYDPDHRRIWVGLDGLPRLLALDARDASTVAELKVGNGLHTLALAADADDLLATHSGSDAVSLIDRRSLAVRRVAVAQTPVSAAWSASARQWAVLSINGGGLSWVDPVAAQTTRTTSLARGAEKLATFDDGRRLLALNPLQGSLDLVDAATARVTASTRLDGHPDQIALSREFAYLRNRDDANVQLIALARLREGQMPQVLVPMGRHAPAEDPDVVNVASVMAPAPEDNGMLLANPGDATLYRYVEGMMVPIGSYSNYRRKARAMTVMDGALVERGPGEFEAPVQAEHSGRYDVIVRNQSPSITACFVQSVEGVPASEDQAQRPVATLLSRQRSADGGLRVVFRLRTAAGESINAGDAQVLAIQPHATWQQRRVASRRADGDYEAVFAGVPGRGDIVLLASAASRGLDYVDGRLGVAEPPP